MAIIKLQQSNSVQSLYERIFIENTTTRPIQLSVKQKKKKPTAPKAKKTLKA